MNAPPVAVAPVTTSAPFPTSEQSSEPATTP